MQTAVKPILHLSLSSMQLRDTESVWEEEMHASAYLQLFETRDDALSPGNSASSHWIIFPIDWVDFFFFLLDALKGGPTGLQHGSQWYSLSCVYWLNLL